MLTNTENIEEPILSLDETVTRSTNETSRTMAAEQRQGRYQSISDAIKLIIAEKNRKKSHDKKNREKCRANRTDRPEDNRIANHQTSGHSI